MSVNFDRSEFVQLNILEDPVVVEIAEAHGKTTAQVLLRFLTQQNVVVIPKSTNPGRLKANFEVYSNAN